MFRNVACYRLCKAWPSGAGIELVNRGEERLPAHNVDVESIFVIVPERGAKSGLGAALLRYVELLWRKTLSDLRGVGLPEVCHSNVGAEDANLVDY